MDFLGNQCPVCHKMFHADDDVVVCPDCGTPHHRECFEAIGHCANESRHGEGYDFADAEENVNSDIVICRSCGKENDKNSFFCKYCAAPLSKEDEQHDRSASGQPGGANGMPFGSGTPIYMDPLGGIPADADMGDGVTAGEIAKYVMQNTPYFVRVFNNIKTVNRSRFSFVGALFGGGYLLYRKMYKLGAILTAVQVAMLIASAFVQSSSVYTDFLRQYQVSLTFTQLTQYISNLASADQFILYLPFILSIASLAMRIVIGITVNRVYFKHCKQQVIRIKSEVSSGESPDTALQTKGGVNMPLAISLLITNLIITYLPGIIQGLF